jgi:hypothetical protein
VRAFGEELRQTRGGVRDRIGVRDADDVEAELVCGVNELSLDRGAQKSRLA